MKLIVDDDLRAIAKAIQKKTAEVGREGWVWNEDEFHIGRFAGGFVPADASDDGCDGFAFGFYAPDGIEYIFRMSFEEADKVAGGEDFSPSLTYWEKSAEGKWEYHTESGIVRFPDEEEEAG